MNEYTNKLKLEEDIENLPSITIEEPNVIFNDDIEKDLSDDYIYARKKLAYIMNACEAVLDHAINEIPNNPGPRPVEAVSSLIKTMNETCDRMLNLHEKMKKIKPKEEKIITSEDKTTIKTTINDIIDQFNLKQE